MQELTYTNYSNIRNPIRRSHDSKCKGKGLNDSDAVYPFSTEEKLSRFIVPSYMTYACCPNGRRAASRDN